MTKVNQKEYTNLDDREDPPTPIEFGDNILFTQYGVDIEAKVKSYEDYGNPDGELDDIVAIDRFGETYDVEEDDISYLNGEEYVKYSDSSRDGYVTIGTGDYIETDDSETEGYVQDVEEYDTNINYYVDGTERTIDKVPEDSVEEY